MININRSLIGKIIYPECFGLRGSHYIQTYKGLNNELKLLIERSGYKEIFSNKYSKAFRFLENLKEHCTQQSKLFELLIGEEGLYSIMLFREKNIRILFCFEEIDSKQAAILLNCFEEKSKRDYVKGVRVANSRRVELGIKFSIGESKMIDRNLENPFDFFEDADAMRRAEFELDHLLVDIASQFIIYRVENKLTQTQLAEKLGVSQVMVSKLESGDYNPSIGQLFKLSKKLGWELKISFGARETNFMQIKTSTESNGMLDICLKHLVVAS